MYKFSNSIVIPKKLEDIFNLFVELKVFSIIWDHILNMEKLSEEPLGEGTKLRSIMLSDDIELQSTAEIIDFITNKIFTIKSKRGGVQTIYKYSFEESDEGTLVQYLAEVNFDNFQEDLAEQIFEVIKEDDLNHLEKLQNYFMDELVCCVS
ncbi:SRPBCC family protein [Clostridium sp. Marseille-QA1073]